VNNYFENPDSSSHGTWNFSIKGPKIIGGAYEPPMP